MRLINADEHECWACTHHATGQCDTWCDHGESFELRKDVAEAKTVDAVPVVRVEWVYWKEQCEYCMNRNTCEYTENQEAIEALKKWEKGNKFWGSLKLICDYYVLDKDKYYLDNQPECNAKD